MIQSSKFLSRFFVVCACAFFSFNLAAQTPVPTTPQSSAIQPPDIKPRAIPQRTIGVDPNKVYSWTIRDAIMAALERNVDIQLERENVRLAEYDLYAARGVYDPSFTSTLSYSPQRIANVTPSAAITTQSGNIISGVGKVISIKTLNYNFGMNRLIERTGGAGFLLKPAQAFGVFGVAFRQQFQGHAAAQV